MSTLTARTRPARNCQLLHSHTRTHCVPIKLSYVLLSADATRAAHRARLLPVSQLHLEHRVAPCFCPAARDGAGSS